jgi:hypothetical protein
VLHKFKFIEAIQSAVTPEFNATLLAGDKLTDVFAKLQGLLRWRQVRYAITAAVTGGTSTAADVVIQTCVIPANVFAPGDVLRFRVYGTATHPNQGGSTLQFWIKIGATKLFSVVITPAVGLTATPFVFEGELTMRTTGASGTVYGAGAARLQINSLAGYVVSAGGGLAYDTTIANNVVVGFVYSNSSASNSLTAQIATMVWE